MSDQPEPGTPFAEKPAAPPASPQTEVWIHPPQPPLSIAHLLVWTAGTGAILGVGQMVGKLSDLPGWLRTYWNVHQAVMSPLMGAAVCSLILAVSRRLTHGPPFPVQPGHWLLVLAGVTTVVNWCVYPFEAIVSHRWHTSWAAPVVFLCGAIEPGWGVVAGIAAGCWLRDRLRWRLYFLVSALLHTPVALGWILAFAVESLNKPNRGSTFGIIQICELGRVWGGLGLGLTLPVLALQELVGRLRRDWLHWLGVAIGLLFALLQLYSSVASRFFQPP